MKKASLGAQRFHLAGIAALVGGLVLSIRVAQGLAWSTSAVLSQELWPDAGERTLAFILGAGGLVAILSGLIRQRYALVKRTIDLVIAGLGLLVVAPFLAAAMVLIRLTSRGPAIFSQLRVGKEGQVFRMYKLRTMVIDAEKGTGPVWASKGDPRITPIGFLLRKSHFDEVPQLINVLKGEMSVIGPRPERPELVARLDGQIQGYSKRLAVAPGITGLAQVWSKYDETVQDVRRKVKYDLLYIRQMCLTADLGILVRTLYVVATGQGAQ